MIETNGTSNYYAHQTMHYNLSDDTTTNQASSRFYFENVRISGWHYISFYINTIREDGLTSFASSDENVRFYTYEETNNTNVRSLKYHV